MKLIIDANIIIASLIRDSLVRKLIINLPFDFYSPDFVFEEIEEHIDEISEKNSLTVKENRELLSRISRYVHAIDFRFYSNKIREAERIIAHVDKKDIPTLPFPSLFKMMAYGQKTLILQNKRLSRSGKPRIWLSF